MPSAVKGFRNLFMGKPVPQGEKCTLYQCKAICPEAAVDLKSGALEWMMPGS